MQVKKDWSRLARNVIDFFRKSARSVARAWDKAGQAVQKWAGKSPKIEKYALPFLTEQEAVELFYELADRQDIPHFAPDGCAERCFHITEILKNRGLTTSSVLAVAGSDFKKIRVDYLDSMRRMGGWKYHVAPTVQVMRENGDIATLVIDPALFDGPVTVKQWKKVLKSDFDHMSQPQPGKPYRIAGMNMEADIKRNRRDVEKTYARMEKYRSENKRFVAKSAFNTAVFNQNRNMKRPKFGQTWTTDRRFSGMGKKDGPK